MKRQTIKQREAFAKRSMAAKKGAQTKKLKKAGPQTFALEAREAERPTTLPLAPKDGTGASIIQQRAAAFSNGPSRVMYVVPYPDPDRGVCPPANAKRPAHAGDGGGFAVIHSPKGDSNWNPEQGVAAPVVFESSGPVVGGIDRNGQPFRQHAKPLWDRFKAGCKRWIDSARWP